MTEMTIEYEDGCKYTIPLVLRNDQTLLGHAALGDQIIAMVDAQHEADHGN